jgi:hypothetical protein
LNDLGFHHRLDAVVSVGNCHISFQSETAVVGKAQSCFIVPQESDNERNEQMENSNEMNQSNRKSSSAKLLVIGCLLVTLVGSPYGGFT